VGPPEGCSLAVEAAGKPEKLPESLAGIPARFRPGAYPGSLCGQVVVRRRAPGRRLLQSQTDRLVWQEPPVVL